MIDIWNRLRKPKKPRWPHGKTAEDVYDEHHDEVMHHINRLKALTHKDSLIHRAGAAMGEDTSKFHQIHGHVLNILKNHK